MASATTRTGGLPASVRVAREAVRGSAAVDASAVRPEDWSHQPLSDTTGTRTLATWRVATPAGPAWWRSVVDDVAGELVVVEVAEQSMPGRGAIGWDERYAEAEAVDRRVHPVLVETAGALRPGSALDVAAGTGRHSLWLAEQGWDVTALEFSRVALRQIDRTAERENLSITTVLGDARVWAPDRDGIFDLVVISFVALPGLLNRAARWVKPGGTLVVAGHAVRNATDGVGGPSDPRLLHDPIDLAARATGARLRVRRVGEVEREVDDGVQIDAVLVATRPEASDR